MIGIAAGDIAPGESGTLFLEEVFELKKKTTIKLDPGQQVYWSVADSEITKTDTDVPAGKAFGPAEVGSTTARIKINA